jgi:hypothetical protein
VRGVIMVGSQNLNNRKAIEHYGKVAVVGTIPVLARIDRRALLRIFQKHFDRRAFAK